MKKIITLIVIIISVYINCNGQNDSTDKVLSKYIKNLKNETESLNNELYYKYSWNESIGLNLSNIDSIIFVKIDNEIKPVVLLIDTISDSNGDKYCDYFAVLIHDKYYYDNQLYFIYSFEAKTDFDYGIVYREPEYYTTEPFTTIKVEKKEINNKNLISYKFYRNYRSHLTPEQKLKLGKIGLINWE